MTGVREPVQQLPLSLPRDGAALLLVLLDSRAPAGAHAHSAGMEAAVTAGLVHDLRDVEQFCRGRLATSGRVTAAFAAAACAAWPNGDWDALDAELSARLPSQALRMASRQLGNGLRRLLRSMFPEIVLPWTSAPHHPLALGAAVAIAGGTPQLAAAAARVATINGPASAAVRLLGLDPLAVYGMLARLASADPDVGPESADVATLPADGAPLLDLLADIHHTAEVRLFAS